jgi:hypothetical protein
MDINPINIHHHHRFQAKKQKFKPVLRVLIEGLATLVDGQRVFADEFGLSYKRVFQDDLESFKDSDSRKVLSEWIRDGEDGAEKLRVLFEILAQHQTALLEAADKVANESIALSKVKKSKFADLLGLDAKEFSKQYKSDHEFHRALHQHLIVTAFTSGYANAREQMKAEQSYVENDEALF